MIEYLESRQLMSGTVVNPTTSAADLGVIQLDTASGNWQASRFDGTQFVSETIANWQSPTAETVVVQGDLWGTGQRELIKFDSTTGSFNAEWKAGSAIAAGTIVTWVPGMDLQFLTVRDLNQDGRDDFIAMDSITGRWAASTTQPSGGYNTRFIGTWQTGVDWQHVNFADVNNDGYDDVVGLNATSNTWNVLLGGNASFQPVTFVSPVSSSNISQVVVDHFDGTAGADIVFRDAVTGNWTSASYSSSKFNLTSVGNWSAAGTWSDVSAVDFWGSGRTAIIGRNTQTNEWRMTWSVGSGYATGQVAIWSPGIYADAQIVDFNLDGRQDVVARQVATGRWYGLSSTATSIQIDLIGTWQPKATYTNILRGDFNGDSKLDLIGLDSNQLTWLGLMSTGGTAYTAHAYNNPEFGFKPKNLSVGDFDADGRLDIIGRGTGTDNWQTLSVSAGQMTAKRFDDWTAYGIVWNDRYVVDFNGDGDTDLLARDATTGDWWLTTFSAMKPTTTKVANWNPSTSWQAMQAVDFDGNGSTDVVARDAGTGSWHLLRSANGVITSTAIANWSTTTTWTDFQVADLFGTGRPLIVARNAASNQWQGLWSIGNGFTSGELRGLAPGRTYTDTKVVKFFGDARETVVTRDAQSGVWYGLSYAAGRFNLNVLGTWNPAFAWEAPTIADLEGDGKQELYGHNFTTGQWLRIGFDGVNATQSVVATSIPSSSLQYASAGNFTHVTRHTLLARNQTSGRWEGLVYDGTTYQITDLGDWTETATWNTTTVGDFNRDGRADLFGYATSTSSWNARTFDGTAWSKVAAGHLTASAQVVDVPGASNATLRAVILHDVPGLQAALDTGDVRTSAQLIRNWVGNAADSALFSNPLFDGAPNPAEGYFGAYAKNRAGSSCGGLSDFYSQVLSLFRIDSLTVSFGDVQADLIHTTVIVPIMVNGSWSFEVSDPTFNVGFTHATTGDPLPYDDIIRAVQTNNKASIALTQDDNSAREFLSVVPVNSPNVVPDRVENGIYIYRWPGYGLDDYANTSQPTLTAHGYSTGVTGIYELMPKVLHVFATNGSGNPSVSNSQKTGFITELAMLGITVPN